MTSQLAALGGTPVFGESLDFTRMWPPLDDVTAGRLQDLYFSRKWTAFSETEPEFAQDFASYQDARHGVFTINGTITLQIALQALGIGPGDEVLVAPLTWYATAMAVRHVGARPVFVDIKPDTLCMDPDKVAAAITPRTRALIPVHAYGSMADMDRLLQIARRHDLRIIEDCAHMHGGAWDGTKVGAIGDIGSFSFQNTKTMSSGEGGICVTNDDDLFERLFRIKQIGYAPGELPRAAKTGPPADLLCYNFRATAFHPVILTEQLRTLDSRLAGYGTAVQRLEARLSQSTRIRFQAREPKTTRQGYFGWIMLFDDPAYADVPIENIQRALEAEGVPVFRAEGPIYDFVLFNVDPAEYGMGDPCTVTEATCARALWLVHPYLGLPESDLDKIADALEKVTQDIASVRDLEIGSTTVW